MKNNGPVTQREVKLSPDAAIISHTDAKGIITYVNDDFLLYSGFTRQECIGKSHNLIRHPDMPKEAFADLWSTLKRGNPWQGLVKNRCKNGDHYWVKATVTPRGDGQYMSVRTPASLQEISEAELIYSGIQRGEKYTLHEGLIFKPTFSGKLSKLRDKLGGLSFFSKLVLPMIGIWFLAIIVVAYQMIHLKERSLIIAGQHSAQDLINTAFNARMFYAEHVLPKARAAGLEMTHDFVGKMHAVPLPASLMRSIAEMSSNQKDGASLRLYSNQPFRFRTAEESRLDDFERSAFDYLSKNPAGVFYSIEQGANGPVFRYAKADVMREQGCIDCHNNHPDTPRKDWRIGDVRGVIAASMPLGSLDKAQNESMMGLTLTLISVLLTSFLTMLFIARKQRNKLEKVVRITSDIAHGNLTTDVPRGRADEIGRIFDGIQTMKNRLYEIAFQMRQTSKSLNQKSVAMMASSKNVSRGASLQSQASESMAAALEELSASIEQIGSNAEDVYLIVEDTGNTSKEGAKAVRESVLKMKDIARRVNESSHAVESLHELSSQIGGIVTTIQGIAEQTNLLALNAAIEAARAGDAGRGFAVVADEVRTLASRTADSTKEITEMVQAIQQSTNKAVSLMKEGVLEVDRGVEKAEAAAESVMAIESKAANVVEAVHDIQQVLSEQTLAAREVAKSVDEISVLAKENAMSAEQSLESSQEMVDASTVMDEISREFTT